MALLDIVIYPDPRLAEVCAPVMRFDAGLTDLVEDMFETMYDAPGRGLAAPQVGVLSRLFVMDATWKDGPGTPMALINPKITWRGPEMATLEEGCLSIPDTPRRVARPSKVRAAWQDVQGDWHEAGFDGFAAAVVQHEFDHLEGRVIMDHPEAP